MVKTTQSQSQKKPDAITTRQEQAQKDRERARERRLAHTAQQRALQLANEAITRTHVESQQDEPAAEAEWSQRLPEAHRRNT